jgi:FdhD protein
MIDKEFLPEGIQDVHILKYRNGDSSIVTDYVAEEVPLQINIQGRPVSITMRTPGDDQALALGFLFTEGIFQQFTEVREVVQRDENTVDVIPEDGFVLSETLFSRNFYATSSCGVCGKSSVDAIAARSRYMPVPKVPDVSYNILTGLPEKLSGVQAAFEKTGGIHACALFDTQGTYLYHAEDVGRHNALDKLIGHAFMAERLPLDNHLLLLSGRASFELMQKAAMAGIPVVAAVGAPSSLAVDLARQNNQLLAGFLKKHGMNIYHAWTAIH